MKQINATQSFQMASVPGKALVIFQLLLLLSCILSAQAPPDLVWQRAFGGSKEDVAFSVQQTPDGGFIVAGSTRSNNGDVSSNSGGSDAWVIKLNGSGNLEWEKTFGGGGNESAQSIQLTADGGYVLAGTTSAGTGNAWVLRLDGDGNDVWEKSYGGSNYDAFNSIAPASDGGFVAVGVKDVHILNGLKGDCWIVKLDAAGNTEWEKTYGDELQDVAYSIQQTSDGGYVVAGIKDHVVYLGSSGDGDFWIFRLDESGNLLWEQVFGGSFTDRAFSVLQTSDGGYVAAGTANIYFTDVNVGGFLPNPMVVKLNADGSTHWVKSFTEDIFSGYTYSVCETPGGGFMVAGGGGLPEGDPEEEEFLIPNLMLMELDAAGNLLSNNSIGGSGNDEALWIIPTGTNGFVVAGRTASNDGDVSGNHGGYDAWVVKLSNSTGIHFVDKDATGANDGTSWQDAYTDLQSALAAAQPGDHIWVAEGTYLPGSSDTSTFLIDKNIKIFGGFAGTETNLLQRDWAAHPTILSGDVNGDDIVDNFTANRSDNVNNILQITAAVTNDMVLDGFTVQGGHADDNSSGATEALRGGGLWSAGSPTMRNCTFRHNYAEELGAGAYFGELISSIVMEDCIFEANKVKESPGFGGAMFLLNAIANQRIERCVFQNNFTGSLALVAANGEISECQFINNKNYSDGAGLFAVMQTDSAFVQVKDCQFTGNVSGQLGAGILAACTEENNHLKVIGCTFEENIAGGLSIGGGMAAIAAGENDNIEISHCVFRGNQADEGGGLLVQATFLGQPAPGATNLNVTIVECVFEENQAPNLNPNIITGGGGIFFLNIPGSENISMNVDSCQFIGNTSNNLGGGLTIYDEVGNASYSVSNSVFSQNTAFNAGGITFINNGDAKSNLNIHSSILQGNGAAWIGGLLVENDRLANSPKDSIFIVNSLIGDNLGGIAGGIFVLAEAEVFIFESTIANNENTGLKLQNKGKARLRNTILHNPGHDNYSSTGIINAISSLGGNLSGDQTLNAFFGAADKTNTDPLFSGTGDHPYQISSSSPAIDAAVPVANVPSFDLAGNARVQGTKMDMGAYESPFFTALKDRAATQQDLAVWPNPVFVSCVVKLENNWRGAVEIRIVDEKGQTVRHWKTEKTARLLEVRIETAELGTGEYFVVLGNGLEVATCKLIKI